MSTSKTAAGVVVGLVAATSLAHAGASQNTGLVTSAFEISQAAQQQILRKAEIILAVKKSPGGTGVKCGPGHPDFDQTCTGTSCTDDCGPNFVESKAAPGAATPPKIKKKYTVPDKPAIQKAQ